MNWKLFAFDFLVLPSNVSAHFIYDPFTSFYRRTNVALCNKFLRRNFDVIFRIKDIKSEWEIRRFRGRGQHAAIDKRSFYNMVTHLNWLIRVTNRYQGANYIQLHHWLSLIGQTLLGSGVELLAQFSFSASAKLRGWERGWKGEAGRDERVLFYAFQRASCQTWRYIYFFISVWACLICHPEKRIPYPACCRVWEHPVFIPCPVTRTLHPATIFWNNWFAHIPPSLRFDSPESSKYFFHVWNRQHPTPIRTDSDNLVPIVSHVTIP